MSLSEILAEAAAQSATRVPPEAKAILDKASADLEALGVGDSALKVGDMIPAAELSSATGEAVSISELLEKGPLIINFYRGGWCPYCNFELKAYQDILSDIEAAGGLLIAVTPEDPDDSLSTTEKKNLKFPILTDKGNHFAQALGICFKLPQELQKLYLEFGADLPKFNPGAGWTLPIPAVYVVDRDGKILLAYVERDYKQRLEPEDALAALTLAANVEQ